MQDILYSVEKLSTFGFAIRTLLVGVILFIISRILPHRAGGQYAGFDFTFFWMMGGLIVSPLYDPKINFINTITAAITILMLHFLISYLGIKSRRFARVVYGKAEVLISQGKIIKSGMKKSLIPIEILLAQLREINVSNLNEVETAILETNGRVSVLKRPEYMPVTPKDLNILIANTGIQLIVINDGKIIEKNLEYIGQNINWLKGELQKQGVSDPSMVYLALLDGEGKLYVSVNN